MAEFVEIMNLRERLCNIVASENDGCNKKCPLYAISGGGLCNTYLSNHPKEAEEIIMKWAKENPIITNADKFKEVFGFEPNEHTCPYTIEKCNGECSELCDKYNFWKEEYILK